MTDPVQLNRSYALALGWGPYDFGVVAFDDALVAAIRRVQSRTAGLQVDGVCGPLTYAARLREEHDWYLERLRSAAVDPTLAEVAVGNAGVVAVCAAKLAWLDVIVDPPSASAAYARERAVIDAMIRTDAGLDWGWEPPYVQDGNFEWCGSLPARAWRAAGLCVDLRRSFFASTYRLDRYAQYLPIDSAPNPRPAGGVQRKFRALDASSRPADAAFAPNDVPRPGDVLLVGDGRPEYGDHVALVESYDAQSGVFTTIEGNGTGLLPDGRNAQGIVRARRTVAAPIGAPPTPYRACRLIRPGFADLDVSPAATRIAQR